MSPWSPPSTRPGVWLKVSQMDGPRPSSVTAPSIWYDAVAAPHRKSWGNARIGPSPGLVILILEFGRNVGRPERRRPGPRRAGGRRGLIECGCHARAPRSKRYDTARRRRERSPAARSEQPRSDVVDLSLIHISEPTRLGMISYAVFC